MYIFSSELIFQCCLICITNITLKIKKNPVSLPALPFIPACLWFEPETYESSWESQAINQRTVFCMLFSFVFHINPLANILNFSSKTHLESGNHFPIYIHVFLLLKSDCLLFSGYCLCFSIP